MSKYRDQSADIRINGLRFSVGLYSTVIARIKEGIIKKSGNTILACSLNDLACASESASMMADYRSIDMCTADSMMLVWWFRRVLNMPYVERVYGPDLFKSILQQTQNRQVRHAFCGSTQKRHALLLKAIDHIAPRITIAGIFSPVLSFAVTDDEQTVLRQIKSSKPSVLWLGIGSPKQVTIASRWKKELPNTTIICVGAAFDFVSGAVSQSPRWMQKSGLEWLHRLVTEPRRLAPRYLYNIPKFIFFKALTAILRFPRINS